MQFQRRIRQSIGHPILTELRANGTQNHPLWLCSVNNETANHHVVAVCTKAASTDVAQN